MAIRLTKKEYENLSDKRTSSLEKAKTKGTKNGKFYRKNEEHENQVALFQLLEANKHKNIAFKLAFATPNGGFRDWKTAKSLKDEGVKAGVPDVCIPGPSRCYHGLFIEMKAGKNKATAEQKFYLERLTELGYKTAVCYSVDEAKQVIEEYFEISLG